MSQLIATKTIKKRQKKSPISNQTNVLESQGGSTGESKPICIVGIGASAGGLAAFESFFSAMPCPLAVPMAFVLVQHLAPDHKSLLTELIGRYTKMKVYEVEDGMVVQPSCVYIIPPGYDMALFNGTLQLMEPSAPRGQRRLIDFFFKSLAQDQHERAVGIVLSGTGSDGTQGVKAIKGAGGMVIAQTPESTEYDAMPQNAIATGLVDFTLAPGAMPAQLINYISQAYTHLNIPMVTVSDPDETLLKKIFMLLRSQTGNDFSQYKPSTILRRIERRMLVHQIETLEAYYKFIQQTPVEVEALFRDLLIGVTSFFRDSDAFMALQEVVPKLFVGKPAGAQIRIWTVGCSTGEEAYSVAILVHEYMEILKHHYNVQIFATDIDSRAITVARIGMYPASIQADISEERLTRFFTAEPDGHFYRINKNIRDMLIFSEQNVIKDPPFSKLDLITCRNLMIYMDGDLQKKIIPLFHYALNPKGILFLGTSETIGEYHSQFAVLDRKAKLYQSCDNIHGAQRVALSRLLPTLSAENATQPPVIGKSDVLKKMPLKELTEHALLQQVTPVAALVNAQGNILYLHGLTGKFLEPAPGEVGEINILTMAREGLKRELTVALHKAVNHNVMVECPGLLVTANGHGCVVNLTINPVKKEVSGMDETLFLVALREVPDLDGTHERLLALNNVNATNMSEMSGDSKIESLKNELKAKEEYLLATNEELETSNEELKSANEEMQSVNEELQSTNEELETSKEELQSVNEELSTVNAELQNKVVDLSRVNNDMNNLLAGTGIATVFVDYELRIMRFTPAATRIINLILSDIGRPVGHIVSNLVDYNQLVQDVKFVLDTLIPKEVEVQSMDGMWYILRIQPYRTLERVIEGVVISFVDITEIVLTRESLRKANDLIRLAVVVRDSTDAITVQDLNGKITAWNPAAVKAYGWSVDEALEMNVRERIPLNHLGDELKALHHLAVSEVLEPYKTERLTKGGKSVTVLITATSLVDEDGHQYAIATTERVAETS